MPVIFKSVPDHDIPEKLRRLQFVPFDSGTGFARPLPQLTEALRVDLRWIREHTRLTSEDCRETYGRESGPRAMEAWSLYQYGKEIRALRALAREGLREAEPFPRRDKYLLLYASLLYALLQSSDLGGLSFAFSVSLATPFWLG